MFIFKRGEEMKAKKGFTLVEILIVVVILGILAAIVIPQFTDASTEAKISSMRSDLQMMRSQIELYKVQHNDDLPSDSALGLVAAGRAAAVAFFSSNASCSKRSERLSCNFVSLEERATAVSVQSFISFIIAATSSLLKINTSES